MAGESRRPWWLAALATGVGIGAGAIVALGFGPASARTVPIATSSMALPPGTISLDERLRNIEDALRSLQTDMTEVKQRLPKKP
jgi:hypothetical protein